MLLLVPLLSTSILLIFLLRSCKFPPDKRLRSYLQVITTYLVAAIIETEILIVLRLNISFKMTDTNSSSNSQWEKLLPPSSDHSATVRYHLYWDTMAIRKIHDATDEPGTLDILIVQVPIPPSVYMPAQFQLLAAANIPRQPDPDVPSPPGASQLQLSLYTATLAYNKITYIGTRSSKTPSPYSRIG